MAVFDNDGTLWCEKPLPIQLDYPLRRFAEHGRRRPLPARAPALEGRRTRKTMHWLGAAIVKHYHGDDSDLKLLLAARASDRSRA